MPGLVRQGLEAGTLVLALSLDAFFASLAYGAGEIRLPGKSALVVALCCSGVLAAGAWAGALWQPLAGGLHWLCAFFLAALGFCKICDSMLKRWVRKWGGRGEMRFRLWSFRCILCLYADPSRADADGSRSLSPREGLLLGAALSLDGAAAGVGAGLGGHGPSSAVPFFSAGHFDAAGPGAFSGSADGEAGRAGSGLVQRPAPFASGLFSHDGIGKGD